MNPNIPGATVLRISRATRGGWTCHACGQEGHAHQIAVFVGPVRGETKGRLICERCTPTLGAAIETMIKALAKASLDSARGA